MPLVVQHSHYSQVTLLTLCFDALDYVAVLSESGKFLLAAKRNRRATYTEYIISMDPNNISRSTNGYVGKMRLSILLDNNISI